MAKRILSLILILLLITAHAAGCGPSGSSGNTEDSKGEDRRDNPWADIMDLSEKKTVHLVVIGSRPDDFDEVLVKINERLDLLIHTSLEVSFISLSDWMVVYPLMLTGGESIDLIYTASWCNYSQEAMRGAFRELTDELFRTYMPVSARDTPEKVLRQAEVNGKIYALPRTYTDHSGYGAVLIRDDILSETGISEVKSYDEYEEFLFCAASLKKDGYGFYAFPSLPMVSELMLPREHMLSVTRELVWDTDKGEITPEKVVFLYDTDEYLEHCLRMARWAEAGVWPSNAISGTIHTLTQFEAGRSFSVVARQHEAQNYLDAIRLKGMSASYSCILDPDAFIKDNDYSGDMIAISGNSSDPYRAALCLDVLKNDREVNLLCHGGIEGRHYLLNPDGSRERGPEYSDYIWSDWAWALRNEKFYPLENQSEEVRKVSKEMDAHLIPDEMWTLAGFHTDDSEIEAELSVIRSLIQEYEDSFNLGVFGAETAEKVGEFRSRLHEAGLDRVMEVWRKEISAYLKE